MPLYETPPICLLLGMDITRKVVTASFCTTATLKFEVLLKFEMRGGGVALVGVGGSTSNPSICR